MQTLTSPTFERYAEFLADRMASKQHLTEDSVRYSFFFAALETTNIKQHEIVLELPHPAFEKKEIDTYVLPTEGRAAQYIEFKFHRVAKSSSPKPQKAGSLFKDFGRLASVKAKNTRCLVIYLTDGEMAEYFDKHEAAYSGFWSKPIGYTFSYDEAFLSKTRATVRKVCGDVHHADVTVVYSAALPGNFHLRVFEVTEHQSRA